VGDRLRDGLRWVIFGRRGCDPRLVARYRWVAASAFAFGLDIALLYFGLAAGADPKPIAGVLAVFSLIGVPTGLVVGKWLVPAGGLPAG
jgi:hypothetical protein